jgi:hypothetical protein
MEVAISGLSRNMQTELCHRDTSAGDWGVNSGVWLPIFTGPESRYQYVEDMRVGIE